MKIISAVRRRLSAASGLAGVYERLDQLDEQVQKLFTISSELHASLSRSAERERDVYRTISLVQEQLIRDLREEAVAQGDFAVERAVEVGQRDLGLAQEQLVGDLRAEIAAQGDFAVERAVAVGQRDLGLAQEQLVGDLRAEIAAQGDFAVQRATAYFGSAIENTRLEITAETASIRRSLRALEAGSVRSPVAQVNDQQDPDRVIRPRGAPIPSDLYAGIEDVFRGNSEMVRQRQASYVDQLDRVTDSSPLLDLGCGRGEWLQELTLRGIPASGVDSNEWFVEQCQEAGLSVELGDIFDRLERQPDESLGAITLFQVLEHLPFMSMVDLLNRACRKLVPGGVLIAEVPNSKNLRVGAGTFWIDPTHERPWYPDLLEFLARQAGFGEVSGEYVNPLTPAPDLSDLPESLQTVIAGLHHAVDGPADYALVARR